MARAPSPPAFAVLGVSRIESAAAPQFGKLALSDPENDTVPDKVALAVPSNIMHLFGRAS